MITVEREPLLAALSVVSKATSEKADRPILAYVLLEVGSDCVVLSATDTTVSISYPLDAQSQEQWRAAVSARMLTGWLKGVRGEKVTIKDNGPQLELRCGTFRSTLKTLDVAQFPLLDFALPDGVLIDRNAFVNTVSRVEMAADHSKEGAYKPVLTGVKIHAHQGTLSFEATDSFRLAHDHMDTDAELPPAVVPVGALALAVDVCALEGLDFEAVHLATGAPSEDGYAARVHFGLGDITIVAQTVAGKYPNLSKLLTRASPIQVALDVKDLELAFRAVLPFTSSDDRNSVIFTTEQDALRVTATTREGEVSTASVTAAIQGTDSFTGKVAARYMADAAVVGGAVVLELLDANSAYFIRAEQGAPNWKYLVLPMKMQPDQSKASPS